MHHTCEISFLVVKVNFLEGSLAPGSRETALSICPAWDTWDQWGYQHQMLKSYKEETLVSGKLESSPGPRREERRGLFPHCMHPNKSL